MRLKWMLPVACGVALGLGVVGGCSSATKKPTQKQQATQDWNRARAHVMFGLAKDQYATGNLDASRKTTDDAQRLDPENGPLRVLSARLAIEAGNLDLADKELAKARKINPKNAEADYLTGVVNQRWQKPEAALEFYSAAADKETGELAYLLAKSEMLVYLGRQEEALRLLQSKVVYFESSAVIRDATGQLLIQFKKYDEAAAVLRQASIPRDRRRGHPGTPRFCALLLRQVRRGGRVIPQGVQERSLHQARRRPACAGSRTAGTRAPPRSAGGAGDGRAAR
jgi:tetratricopeptide (TPR) repeat protein